ncbi:MAG: TRAP transporter small permease subunit, partial [Pseudomonadota bacterium]
FAADAAGAPFGARVAGLSGYEDFVRLAVAAAAFLFLPLCQARRGHVSVDFLSGRLPAAMRRALDRLWPAALAGLALFLAGMTAQGMAQSRADGVVSPILGWPEGPFYAPAVFALALWAAIAIAQAAAPTPVTDSDAE